MSVSRTRRDCGVPCSWTRSLVRAPAAGHSGRRRSQATRRAAQLCCALCAVLYCAAATADVTLPGSHRVKRFQILTEALSEFDLVCRSPLSSV